MKGAFYYRSYVFMVFTDPQNLGIDISFVIVDQMVEELSSIT